MKKPFLRHILASSLIFLVAGNSTYADENLPSGTKKIQRSFINLSFENLLDNQSHNGNGYKMIDQKYVDGWNTTASMYDNNNKLINKREMELWRKGTGNAQPAKDGDLYSELNGHEPATLYQNICLLQDDEFDWSLYHMGRNSATEKMAFVIGEEVIDDGRIKALPFNELLKVKEMTAVQNAWTQHKSDGNIKASSILGSAAAKVVAFGFQAVQGSKLNEGNFLDNIKVNLKPAIEFSAQSGETFENNTNKYQSIDFKIVGLVQSDLDVSFVIDLKKNVAPSKIATYEKDYKIYSMSGKTYTEIPVKLSSDGSQLQFTYTVKYNSQLDYANGVIIKGLVVELLDNELLDGDKVIPFGLNNVQSGTVKIMGTEVCGTAPISEFSYTILDNDTDLSISKTLKMEKLPLAEGLVSYDLVLENKGKGTARGVFLKDTLLANLSKTDSTALTCTAMENGGKTGVCPVLTENSVEQLFSKDGLALNSIAGGAKFQFNLSNLKVSKEDLSGGKYLGKILNRAEVSTTSNDIDKKNNEATAENRIIAASDLSNNKAGATQKETGTGLFYIAQEGRNGATALLTKTADTLGKAYFPLNIQNSSVYSQTYKLHASSTAIKPASIDDYTSLDISSITSFTTGMQVKFYPVSASECKATLSSSDISQINVPANSTMQVCAEMTGTSPEAGNIPVWFAIESVETSLGDIIKNSITYSGLSARNLILVNDQQAQVQIGGTYVFAHRLTNNGSITETGIHFSLNSLTPKDGFAYTLFFDKNSNGVLDSGDVQVKDTDATSVEPGDYLALLVKVQAPSTSTNGMRSQVELKAIPLEILKDISQLPIMNTDTITVGINQILIQKMQFKQPECIDMTKDQVINATYQITSQTIGRNDCILYRIMVANIGAETVKSIDVSDMYPAYTTSWNSNKVLPMTDSNEAVTEHNRQIKMLIKELKPSEKKSLYFGIKLQ